MCMVLPTHDIIAHTLTSDKSPTIKFMYTVHSVSQIITCVSTKMCILTFVHAENCRTLSPRAYIALPVSVFKRFVCFTSHPVYRLRTPYTHPVDGVPGIITRTHSTCGFVAYYVY